MKRKRLQLLLALLMTAATGAWADELTVYDGTFYENYSPANICYIDEYTRSQTVIPSTALTAMKGCNITAMTFYSNSFAASGPIDYSFDVYLKEVSYTAFAESSPTFEPKSSCTSVHQGKLSISNHELTITFSEPFHYNGGNLLIGMENTSKVMYYEISFLSRYNSSSLSNISIHHADDLASATTIVKGYFIPKTTFTYVVPTYTVNLNDGELNPTTWTAKVGDATEFGKLPLENVTEGTTVTLSYSGTGEVKRITAVTGALTGKFTVSATGKKVVFSQGNLQAVCTSADESGDTQETWTWRFAPNQWDCVGNAAANTTINGNGSTSATGTVDLFGWVGKSNTTWTGAAMYGVTNDQHAEHYGNAYPDELKSDWGKTMGDGWFTMTVDEWIYLLSGRTDAAQKYGHGSVGGVNGLILLPDSWTLPDNLTFTPGNSAWTNSYTTDEWAKMEAAGAVFLPAAGDRYHGNMVQAVGSVGFYMSSTSSGQYASYKMLFEENNFTANASYTRNNGYSVRLVRQTK